jgi:hypothetical protein
MEDQDDHSDESSRRAPGERRTGGSKALPCARATSWSCSWLWLGEETIKFKG